VSSGDETAVRIRSCFRLRLMLGGNFILQQTNNKVKKPDGRVISPEPVMIADNADLF
jgi:hypothetical protein